MRSVYLSGLVAGCIISVATGVSYAGDVSLSVTYLNRFTIKNERVGLNHPSGLTLSHERGSLWTVSDNTEKVFKLNLHGKVLIDKSFTIPDKELEGIALDSSGEYLYTVKERENEIIKINVNLREVAGRKRISEMAGYNMVAQYFVGSPPNKGLEGITWNTHTNSLFVMKEGVPGLLMEISSDLKTIRSHILLTHENGFIDNEVVGDDLDFSGICYDQKRKLFLIVSDKGRRLFVYDRERNIVIQSFALGYSTKGDYQEIKKAEGIAVDPDSNRLFIVSEKEARLYVYDIRE